MIFRERFVFVRTRYRIVKAIVGQANTPNRRTQYRLSVDVAEKWFSDRTCEIAVRKAFLWSKISMRLPWRSCYKSYVLKFPIINGRVDRAKSIQIEIAKFLSLIL